jgi:hypothetical protein
LRWVDVASVALDVSPVTFGAGVGLRRSRLVLVTTTGRRIVIEASTTIHGKDREWNEYFGPPRTERLRVQLDALREAAAT